jgi:hypothetical protein
MIIVLAVIFAAGFLSGLVIANQWYGRRFS